MSPLPPAIVQPRCRSRSLRDRCEKACSISIGFGSRAFVCGNTAFIAEQIFRRKHTKQAKRDLPSLVTQLVEPLTEQREAQARAFRAVQGHGAHRSDGRPRHHDHVPRGRDQRPAHRRRGPRVDQPSFAYEQYVNRSAWQLFNAATFALKGRATDYDTPKLRRIIDGVCEAVH